MISVVVTGAKKSEDATGSNPAEEAGLNHRTLTTGMAVRIMTIQRPKSLTNGVICL